MTRATKLHSRESEVRFCVGLNPSPEMPEVCDSENF